MLMFNPVIHVLQYSVFVGSCSVVMIDEAHERTLYTDIIIGLLKKVCSAVFVDSCWLSVSLIKFD